MQIMIALLHLKQIGENSLLSSWETLLEIKKITARSSKAKYAATLQNIILKIKKCK